MSTTDRDGEEPTVSFAAVAREDAAQSVAHETDAVDPGLPGDLESEDGPPDEPDAASLLAGGPVAEGDQPTI